jgi:ATP-dependent exoDNAse (exonuclease V) alpha subunit
LATAKARLRITGRSHFLIRRLGLDPIHDVQVRCPMNRGGIGARSLNIELQAALNPPQVREQLFFVVGRQRA